MISVWHRDFSLPQLENDLLRFKLEREPWPAERNLENEVCVGNNSFNKQVPKGVLCLHRVSDWPSWAYLKGLTLMGSALVSWSYSTRCVFPCKPHNAMRWALLPPLSLTDEKKVETQISETLSPAENLKQRFSVSQPPSDGIRSFVTLQNVLRYVMDLDSEKSLSYYPHRRGHWSCPRSKWHHPRDQDAKAWNILKANNERQ